MKFSITVENFYVTITKIAEKTYNFYAMNDDLTYEDIHTLNMLSFVENLQDYVTTSKIEIEKFKDSLVLKLPVPFSSKVELIIMKNTAAMKKIDFYQEEIKKLNDELAFYKNKQKEEIFYLSFNCCDWNVGQEDDGILSKYEIDQLCQSLENDSVTYINYIQNKHGIYIEQIFIYLNDFRPTRDMHVFLSFSRADFQYAEFYMKYIKSDANNSFNIIGCGGLMPCDFRYIRICNTKNNMSLCQLKSAFR